MRRRCVADVSRSAFHTALAVVILIAILPEQPTSVVWAEERAMTLAIPTQTKTVRPGRWRFTVEQYHRLFEADAWPEDVRTELIHGDIYVMAPIGGEHIHSSLYLVNYLAHQFGRRALVSAQNSLQLADDTEVMPDVAVVGPDVLARDDRLWPSDVAFIVEIAQSSVRHDRAIKLPLYARSGIPEYWIAVLPKRQLEVYRDLDAAAGRYRTMAVLEPGDTVSPERWPDVRLDVADIVRAKRG